MANRTLTTLTAVLQMNNSKFKQGLSGSQKALNGFSKGIKAIGGMIAGAFAVGAIVSFAKEASDLAGKAEGIERAFRALNKPGLLDELRKATKGTVSDMELMKNAVRANNFKIPLEQMGMFLAFAQKRAIETGESVEYLVESITNGIARKSLPILDNLGLSATEVREEFNKTGDMASAVANIIERDMGNAANAPLTMAEKQAQLNAQIENSKVAFGNMVNQIKGKVLPTLTRWAEDLNFILSSYDDLKRAAWDNTTAQAVARDAEEVKFLTDRFMEHNKALTEKEAKEKAVRALLEQYKTLLAGINPEEEDRINLVRTQIGELEGLIRVKQDDNKLSEKELELIRKRNEETRKLNEAMNDLAIATARGFKSKETTKGQAPGFDMLINPDETIQKEGWEDAGKAMMDSMRQAEEFAQAAQQQVDSLNSSLTGMVAGALTQFVDILSTGIATGDLKGSLDKILDLFGSFMSQMGAMFIAYGVAMEAFKKAKNPYVLIAAGIALVAIGAAISAASSNFTSNVGAGGGYGGGGGGFYNNAPNYGRSNINESVEFKIQGQDLVGVLDRQNSKTDRYS